MLHHITKIIDAKPYILTLEFDKKEILQINLTEDIKTRSASEKSLYRQLLEPEYFKSVKLQPEWRTIYWDNGLDFCPDLLYEMGKSITLSH